MRIVFLYAKPVNIVSESSIIEFSKAVAFPFKRVIFILNGVARRVVFYCVTIIYFCKLVAPERVSITVSRNVACDGGYYVICNSVSMFR